MPARAQYLPKGLETDEGVMLNIAQCEGCGLVQLMNDPVPYWREAIHSDVSHEMRDFRLKQLEDLMADWHIRTVIELGRDFRVATTDYDAFLLLDGLEHVPNPNELLTRAKTYVPEGGMGLIEVPNFDMILKYGLVTEFMLDHLTYFTASTLRRALSINGLEVLSLKPVWHDYILSAVVKKRRKVDLSGMRIDKNRILGFIEGKKAAVWGAGHQALSTLRLLDLDASKIQYVVDKSPAKQGCFTPVTGIPIVPPETLTSNPVEALVIMCGSYSSEVAKEAMAYKVPNVMIV
jgi:hypothetical protein